MGSPDRELGLHGRIRVHSLEEALERLIHLVDTEVLPRLDELLSAAPVKQPGHLGIGPAGGPLRWAKAIYVSFTPRGEAVLSHDMRAQKPLQSEAEGGLRQDIRAWAVDHW